MTETTLRRPVALIGCNDEWMCRSLESVFAEKGYDVTRTGSGKQALKLARRGGYDVLMLDELFLKLGTFLRARHELAASQVKSLMDPTSGLYTQFGLNQVAEQVEARALRNHEAVACVAFSSQPTGLEPGQGRRGEDMDSFADVVHLLREQARKSDVVAKTGDSQLAILAPDTDAAGARLLVARLQREIDTASKRTTHPGSFRLRAGYCAVSDLSAANIDITEMVLRAKSALAHVPMNGLGEAVLSFDDLPLS